MVIKLYIFLHFGLLNRINLSLKPNSMFFMCSDFNCQADYSKNIIIEEMTRKVELLDVPEDFQMGDYFTEYGQGFLLVYSISDYQTFENAKTMREDIMKIKKR